MEPITIAGAFASIVGLICNFRQEKGEKVALDHQQFIEWLEYHRHEDLKKLICNTAALQAEVDSLLKADHVLMLQKLDKISDTLAHLLSQVAEFRGLTNAILPSAEISDQAFSILKQLVNSGSTQILIIKHLGGLTMQLDRGGHVSYTEPRFLPDDLDNLVMLGLLTRSLGSRGTEMFRITRNAARYVEAV